MRAKGMCPSKNKCFGKTFNGTCWLLITPYEEGRCPFQKPDARITDGKLYPFNTMYGKEDEGD